MKTAKVFRQIGRHLVLLFLACLWLVPILWLVVTSFGVDEAGMTGVYSSPGLSSR